MEEIKIGVVGLGYVGLPLARLFATKYAVVGFDLKKERIEALNRGIDRTLEVSEEVMKSVLRPSVPKRGEKGLYCSCDPEDLRDCNYYIITVPTPVDKHNRPDLTPLIRASETVGQVIVRGDIVIYESTVYPGATEEDCIPVIERVSGLKYNVDFFAGYSPERINPGDKQHTVEKIKKVTSGSTPGVAEKVNALYHSVIVAGTHLAPSIRVAEAAKVIENSQRDINIAFVNELSKIFNLMHIDTQAVLEAAATKWNFLSFRPGFPRSFPERLQPQPRRSRLLQPRLRPPYISWKRRWSVSAGSFSAVQYSPPAVPYSFFPLLSLHPSLILSISGNFRIFIHTLTHFSRL